MLAGLGVALANGLAITDALRLASGAGALNVTRHGLGSGTRGEIERLAQFVAVRPLPYHANETEPPPCQRPDDRHHATPRGPRLLSTRRVSHHGHLHRQGR